MAKARSGISRAAGEVIIGAVTVFLIEAVIKFLLPPEYLLIYRIVVVIGMVLLIRAMKFWSTRYIVGWLFGMALLFALSGTSLLGTWELLLYLGVPVFVLVKRKI
jgi:NADH:ubiquinone oxidoreductase subunit 6 (subunit J)